MDKPVTPDPNPNQEVKKASIEYCNKLRPFVHRNGWQKFSTCKHKVKIYWSEGKEGINKGQSKHSSENINDILLHFTLGRTVNLQRSKHSLPQAHRKCLKMSVCTNLSCNVTQQTRLNCDLILALVFLLSVLISVQQRIPFTTPEMIYSCTNTCFVLCFA